MAKGYGVGAGRFPVQAAGARDPTSKVAAFIDLFKKTEEVKRQTEQLGLAEQREMEQKLRQPEAAVGVGPAPQGDGATTAATQELTRPRRGAGPREGSRGSGQQGQEPVPGQHEPRAAHAAQRHHRLQRDAPGGGRGPGRRTTSSPTWSKIHGAGKHLLGADQRHPRSLEDRGGQDGARTSRRSTSARWCARWRRRSSRWSTRTATRCEVSCAAGRRRDARRPDQGPPEPVQPADQRLQVHRGRRRSRCDVAREADGRQPTG